MQSISPTSSCLLASIVTTRKLIVGLTGGIGSGKSEVCRRFHALGITIVDADIVAREVVRPGTPLLNAIENHFGPNILTMNANHQRELNRSKLRQIIFNDAQEKCWLENLMHPVINQHTQTQLANAPGPYAILASPLLLETKQYQLVDRVLVIDASEELQINRASQRDSNNEDQIKAIMATQLSREARCARANDIIENHGSLFELDEQVEKLHSLYLELSTKKC